MCRVSQKQIVRREWGLLLKNRRGILLLLLLLGLSSGLVEAPERGHEPLKGIPALDRCREFTHDCDGCECDIGCVDT